MIFAALPTESQAKSHATQRQATGRTDGAAYVTLNDWRTPSERPYARCVRGSADDRRRRWDAAERRRNLHRQRNGRRARRTCIGRSRMGKSLEPSPASGNESRSRPTIPACCGLPHDRD